MANYVLTPSAVRKLRGALAATPGNTGATGAPSPVNIDDYPPPFTVRWSASVYNGAGGWVLWAPDRYRLVYVGNAYQGAFRANNIDQADSLPTGWLKLRDVSSSDTAIWLNIMTYTLTGAVSLNFAPGPSSPSTGFTCISLLVATMSADSTGAKRVKQFIDSAVVISKSEGGGSSVSLDDISADWNTGNQVQIKDWDTGTPASSTTIAQDINAGNTTAQGTVVERTTGGVLQYKKPGTLAQLLGSSVTFSGKSILTGWDFNTTTHDIEVSTAVISAANGVITSWVDQPVQKISTTAISDIL